jgi:hypothetical protein
MKTANGAELDPVFAAIAEHKRLIKGSNRLEDSFRTARAKAEKRYGKWIRAPNPGEWPGEAIVSPFYDQWNRADAAERKAAMRMARTKPTTTSGAAAMIAHASRELEAASDSIEDWLPVALKTVAAALVRMEAALCCAFAIASGSSARFAASCAGCARGAGARRGAKMTPEKPTPRRRPWLVTPKVPPGGSSANLPGAMLRL